jgi:hypothetical protein
MAHRRLCRLNRELVGAYLDAARQGLRADEPDFCALVVGPVTAEVGHNWGNVPDAFAQRDAAFRYWRDRSTLDNQALIDQHGELPTFPGLRLDEANV